MFTFEVCSELEPVSDASRVSPRNSDSYGLVSCGAPSLTRGQVCLLYMLLALASAVFLGSESLGTCDHILLFQIWDFPFLRPLRLAGSRWRHSTPPPHGCLISIFYICSPSLYRLSMDCIENAISNSSSMSGYDSLPANSVYWPLPNNGSLFMHSCDNTVWCHNPEDNILRMTIPMGVPIGSKLGEETNIACQGKKMTEI
jgi:hypothetical protein